ncbi:MAG TPA: cache domain-containing protein, partial [Spirochaetota bacterium]|nr:cache domain-containing protein [Spirochaetota bacterium]
MLKKNNLSLVLLIFVVYVLMFFVSMLFVLFSVQQIVNNSIKQNITEKSNQLCYMISEKANDLIVDFENTLLLMRNKKYLNIDFITDVIKNYDWIDDIFIIDKNGLVKLTSKKQSNLNYDFSKMTFFTETMKTGKKYISESFISNETYEPTVSISILIDDYIFVGLLSLKNLASQINKLSHNKAEVIGIIDKNGYFIAHTDINFIYQRRNILVNNLLKEAIKNNKKNIDYKNENGKDIVISFSKVAQTEWYVVVLQEKENLFKPIKEIRVSFFAIILISLILSIFF